jgi:hypothetical protein
MSRYQQVDLELWSVHNALEAAGDVAGAKQIHDHRAALHSMARQYLAGLKNDIYVTQENPMGLKYLYELLEYEHSALHYETFDDYLRNEDDNKMFVWRGDRGTNMFQGINPDHNSQAPSALTMAHQRALRRGAENLIGELEHDEGSSNGTGFICTSTDASVAASFGGGVGWGYIGQLPQKVQDYLSKLKPGIKISIRSVKDALGLTDPAHQLSPDEVDLSGLTLADVQGILTGCGSYADEVTKAAILSRAQALLKGVPATGSARLIEARGRKPLVMDLTDLATPSASVSAANPWAAQQQASIISSIVQALDAARDYLIISTGPNGQATVQFPQKAFLVQVDKADGIAGCQSQGFQGFTNEEEWTMWVKARISQILAALPAERLMQTNPVAQPVVSATPAPSQSVSTPTVPLVNTAVVAAATTSTATAGASATG